MRQRAIKQTEWVLPIIGIPDQLAQELADLSRGGLSGIGISFVITWTNSRIFAVKSCLASRSWGYAIERLSRNPGLLRCG